MNYLFIVEKDFLRKHVGVARVIIYYYELISAKGFNVDFAYINDGKLIKGRIQPQYFDEKDLAIESKIETPWYITKVKVRSPSHSSIAEAQAKYRIEWSSIEAFPDDYSINFITAPWVCALGLKPLPRVVGIIYDLVPNLAAASCIRLGSWDGLLTFAKEHDIGFRYYIANADKILCISNSTKNDFLDCYKTARLMKNNIVVNVPYRHLDLPSDKACLYNDKSTNNVLLVNGLDWRKGFEVTYKVLKKTAQTRNFNLIIVGKERISLENVYQMFEDLEGFGINIEWWRFASDETLQRQYKKANVLLFPSLYEGLGLPILEAQSIGVPVITSNISSCPEFNYNEKLCFKPDDIDGMSCAVSDLLDDSSRFKSGEVLINELSQRLALNQSSLNEIFNI